MSAIEFSNLVNGKETANGKFFDVNSPFYPDYSTRVHSTDALELAAAISKAREAESACNSLDFEERYEILKTVSKKIKFGKDALEYAVKMTGMPISSVEKKIDDIKNIFVAVPGMLLKRIGVMHGKLARHVMPDSDILKILHPIEGFVYAVTPGNDPRVSAFVSAWLVSLGIPCILKASRNDLMVSHLVAKKIIEAGYPASGLSVMCWDSSESRLNFNAVDAASAIWAFGNDITVDNLLRFEGEKDHFSGKIVLRHATGRSAAICDKTIDYKKTADIITESSLDWPIGCNSLKAVFDANDMHDELVACLKENFEKLESKTGDPMKKTTKVGYTDPKILSRLFKYTGDQKLFGSIQVICGKHVSDIQATPLLVKSKNHYTDFVSSEISAYVLGIKKCESFEDAIKETNESAGNAKRLAVSVFSGDESKVLRSHIRAHHIKRLRPTTELDVLFHEGNDYLHKLTVPQIHRVERKISG